VERDSGRQPGLTIGIVAPRFKVLERDNRELRQAKEILRKASAYIAQAEFAAGSSHVRFHRRSSPGG
jgi:transposase